MKRKGVRVEEATEVRVQGVEGFFEKTVTKFGSGAKIDCPKLYLGRDVYVVVRRPKKRKGRRPPPAGAASDVAATE